MGVYHLMGLGRSPGAITGPLTYLAHRYQRWNEDDQRFFARSGGTEQGGTDDKVGDVQVLVLFTTREVLSGEVQAFNYIDNLPGQIKGSEKPGRPMKEILRELLRREWPDISGSRPYGTVFWCGVDRRDIRITYERVISVIAALAGVGGQGKEMWINLTGGNNVINLALQMAAVLSGAVSRLYYVQAENPDAEKCVRFTAEHGYWVDLPVMPLVLGQLSRAIIELLAEKGLLTLSDLYSILKREYWILSNRLTSEALRNEYLSTLWKQGLIAEASDGYTVGPQWKLVKPYLELWEREKASKVTLEQLAEQEEPSWIKMEKIEFKRS